jgi:hypothetical protein
MNTFAIPWLIEMIDIMKVAQFWALQCAQGSIKTEEKLT